jgi:hypothetical protein
MGGVMSTPTRVILGLVVCGASMAVVSPARGAGKDRERAEAAGAGETAE